MKTARIHPGSALNACRVTLTYKLIYEFLEKPDTLRFGNHLFEYLIPRVMRADYCMEATPSIVVEGQCHTAGLTC